MTQEISATIADYVEANFVLDGGGVALDQPLKEFMDSTGMLELLLFLEDSFGISIEDDEVLSEAFETVNKLAAFVELKLPDNSAFAAGSGSKHDASEVSV